MSMFDNYNQYPSDYIPNNRKEVTFEYIEFQGENNYEERNILDEFLGYSVHYGDNVKIKVTINPSVYVEENAFIFVGKDSSPDNTLAGDIGKYAYNIDSLKCWKCLGADEEGKYIWKQQKKFTIPVNGEKEVTLNIFDNISDYTAKLYFVDFRGYSVVGFDCPADDTFEFSLTSDFYSRIKTDCYKVYLYVENNKTFRFISDFSFTILGANLMSIDTTTIRDNDSGDSKDATTIIVNDKESLPEIGDSNILYIVREPASMYLYVDNNWALIGFDHGDPSHITGGGAFEHGH